ncbi:H+/Cl- antiporter ClcA [Paraburkholderia bannensis]|uniref:H+/Cl- antiporter ClcA n=1 Tax=Paraburkholderia bannensis TaxID=765414 RepID=A0A7W9WWA6_9BURK|nr:MULTISPECIES: chloride channel protein [Paraburkholderia]MBB3261716.1 H+/Cl- antiporter ClcA [Paraburkholderia sp. WP4_3_2]MBB6106664.1 H+/Cl- antiporter ClcA [Paraburkholderia bannensis]
MAPRSEPLAVSHAIRWGAVVTLTGLCGGLSGLGLAALLHAIQHLAYGYSPATLFNGESFLDGVGSASAARRVGVLAGCGVVAGVGWLAVYRWCKPLISISRAVKSADPRMPVVATTCHALLQIITVALGSPLGREVAPREIGAMIAARLSSYARLTLDESTVMVACGAGAGLAAVYNVPLAGTLYVLEGLLVSYNWRALVPAIITSMIAALIARMGLGNLPQYAVPQYASTPSLMIWSAIAGPLFGLAAVQFTRLMSSARAQAPRGAALPALCLLNFVFIGLLATQLPILLGNGKGPAQVGFDGSINLELAAILLVLRVLITWTSLRAGAAGGLLTPGLCNGALFAILLGGVWSTLWPGTPLGAFAVIGSAAFLASSMRVPLTALALIFEFARPSQEFLIPMLIAVSGSVLTAEYVRSAMAASASRRVMQGEVEQTGA